MNCPPLIGLDKHFEYTKMTNFNFDKRKENDQVTFECTDPKYLEEFTQSSMVTFKCIKDPSNGELKWDPPIDQYTIPCRGNH